jgi:transcriptional regulator with XRE-family HTH domain
MTALQGAEVRRRHAASIVRKLREKLHMSQAAFAEALGSPGAQALVSRWERGLVRPNRETLVRIAELAGESPEIFEPPTAFDVVDAELALRLVDGGGVADSRTRQWILNEIETAFLRAGLPPAAWPSWLVQLRESLSAED